MPMMYIMRGVSGSGKTTEAKKLIGTIFSTDDYFMVKGKYLFDKRYLTIAHKQTLAKLEMWMMAYGDGNMGEWKANVIIDNVNYCHRDMLPYMLLANKYNYEVSYCEPKNDLWLNFKVRLAVPNNLTPAAIEELAEKFAARNTHDVPAYAIANQMRRWELM